MEPEAHEQAHADLQNLLTNVIPVMQKQIADLETRETARTAQGTTAQRTPPPAPKTPTPTPKAPTPTPVDGGQIGGAPAEDAAQPPAKPQANENQAQTSAPAQPKDTGTTE